MPAAVVLARLRSGDRRSRARRTLTTRLIRSRECESSAARVGTDSGTHYPWPDCYASSRSFSMGVPSTAAQEPGVLADEEAARYAFSFPGEVDALNMCGTAGCEVHGRNVWTWVEATNGSGGPARRARGVRASGRSGVRDPSTSSVLRYRPARRPPRRTRRGRTSSGSRSGRAPTGGLRGAPAPVSGRRVPCAGARPATSEAEFPSGRDRDLDGRVQRRLRRRDGLACVVLRRKGRRERRRRG